MHTRRPSYFSFLSRVILLGIVVAATAGIEQYLVRRATPRHLVALATGRAEEAMAAEAPPADRAFEELSHYETLKVLVSLTGTGVVVATAVLLFAPLAKQFAIAADAERQATPSAQVEPHGKFRQRILRKRN